MHAHAQSVSCAGQERHKLLGVDLDGIIPVPFMRILMIGQVGVRARVVHIVESQHLQQARVAVIIPNNDFSIRHARDALIVDSDHIAVVQGDIHVFGICLHRAIGAPQHRLEFNRLVLGVLSRLVF